MGFSQTLSDNSLLGYSLNGFLRRQMTVGIDTNITRSEIRNVSIPSDIKVEIKTARLVADTISHKKAISTVRFFISLVVYKVY
jgi:hypothetical protein